LESFHLEDSSRTLRLDCLNGLPRLRSIYLRRLGVSRLDGLAHPSLEKLTIWFAGNLATLRIAPFPRLDDLDLRGLLRLESIDFSSGGTHLEVVSAQDCRSLRTLSSLGGLRALRRLFLGRTALDLNSILRRPLPPP